MNNQLTIRKVENGYIVQRVDPNQPWDREARETIFLELADLLEFIQNIYQAQGNQQPNG